MKNSWQWTAAAWAAVTFNAQAVVIDFDGVVDGTVINSQYAGQGVTFNNPLGVSASNADSPNIFARSSLTNASSPNVVSVFSTGLPAFDARFGAVEAVFSQGWGAVSIDAAIFRLPEGLGTPLNAPKLEIYDLAGSFITSVLWDFASIPQPGAGGITAFQTLSYSSVADNIGKVRFLSGQPGGSPSNFGVFDNLTFTSNVPEPQTAALMLAGLAALALSMRRRGKK